MTTSIFTLPTPRKEKQQKEQQFVGVWATSATAALHAENSYKEFPDETTEQSPSLPWLVNYWSSSLFRAPEFIFDHICSCTSAVDPTGLNVTKTSGPLGDISISSNSLLTDTDKSYFDDTIIKSNPKVDRSPKKMSQPKWEALRSVVASQGDYTINDYCDIYGKDAELIPTGEDSKEVLNDYYKFDLNDANSRYPTKNSKNRYRVASILTDDSKDDDEEMDLSDTDDIRMEPPADESHSGRDLFTCHSFDNNENTASRYLCGNSQSHVQPSTPPPRPSPRSPPLNRLPDRRRSRQPNPSTMLTPRTLDFQRLSSRAQHSPAPSNADTYSTVSLSHSFAREFDDESDEYRTSVRGNQSIFLDRLAAETVPTESSSRASSPSRTIPFRRIAPRTELSENSGHEDEKKEEKDDEHESPSTPPRRTKRTNDVDEEAPYRRLVRMSPDNYKHGKSLSSSYDAWLDCDKEEQGTQCRISSASPSLLLPLHSYQRVLSIPHDLDSEETDHSGYLSFRQKQKVGSPNHLASELVAYLL